MAQSYDYIIIGAGSAGCLMGKNFWPYGIEANRKELEAVTRYVYEQGLVKEQINFEEMFDASTLKLAEKSE